MIKYLTKKITNIDPSIKIILRNGLILCICILITATILLSTYIFFYNSPNLYYVGILLFKTGIMYSCMFLGCSIAFDEIIK